MSQCVPTAGEQTTLPKHLLLKGKKVKKKKVYIVFFIYNENSWNTYGSFDTKKKAEDYIARHHLYKTNSPMYILEAYKYKKK